jgi:hypothetical protein
MRWKASMTNQMRQDQFVKSQMQRLEAQTDPDKLADLYLRTFVITSSHLFDIIAFFSANSADSCLGRWDVFCYMEECIRRISDTPSMSVNGGAWLKLFRSLESAIKMTRDWSGNAVTGTAFSQILLVSAFILARLSNGGRTEEAFGVEFAVGVAASRVPFPIDLTIPLEEQARVAMTNLDWLCGHAST